MLETQAILKVVRGERVYRLELPNDAPAGETHDVLFEMKAWVIDRMNSDKKVEAPVIPQIPKVEVCNAECTAVG